MAADAGAQPSGGSDRWEAARSVVICLRHSSTPVAYTDEVWAKYGAIFADRMKFNDPRGYSIVSMH